MSYVDWPPSMRHMYYMTDTIETTFSDLGLNASILQALTDLGYEKPSPIQAECIPHLLGGRDVLGMAQTGSGKTAAFSLPLLHNLDPELKAPQILVLAPTRELAVQVAEAMTDFSKHMHGVNVVALYGGQRYDVQLRALRQGPQIVVGTPGRLLDLIKRRKVDLAEVNTVILDEADEMLNMGFVDDINEILEHVPEQRKMLLFSATMPAEIAGIAKNYMHNPTEYVVGTRNEGSANVQHCYYMVKASDKYLALKRIVDSRPRIYGIVFCRTRAMAKEVADNLIQDGYNADALHGDLSQAQRDAVMKKFRDRNLQILVATDVAARGLDVDDLTHIISYSLPDDNDVYNHRSGRTGRAGKTGTSIAIIHSRERNKLRDIEKHIGKTFERREVPQAEEIIGKQLHSLIDKLERVDVNEEGIAPYMCEVLKKLSWLSSEDLLKRVLSLEFNRLLEYYRNAPVIEYVPDKGEKKKREKKEHPEHKNRSLSEKDSRVAQEGYERIYINVGKADGFFAPDLIRMLNANTKGQKIGLGRIDLLSNYSLFDVMEGEGHRVVSALKNAEFYGKRLYLEPAVEGKDYAGAARTEKAEIKKNRSERRREERMARIEAAIAREEEDFKQSRGKRSNASNRKFRKAQEEKKYGKKSKKQDNFAKFKKKH